MTLVAQLRRLVEQQDSAPTKVGLQRVLDRQIDRVLAALLKQD